MMFFSEIVINLLKIYGFQLIRLARLRNSLAYFWLKNRFEKDS
jgi:hypothetical protein